MFNKLAQIQAHLMLFEQMDINPQVTKKIIHLGQLKSSLYSARIEGIAAGEKDFITSEDIKSKKEIYNIIKALNYLLSTKVDKINLELILKLHQFVCEDVIDMPGRLRNEAGAIYDQYGSVVYISPESSQIRPLLNELFLYINSEDESQALINAFIAHLIFEKIHPFTDGNGRVGRLLVNAILKVKKFGFDFFIPYEQYLDEHKSDYYYHLDKGLSKPQDYLIFMLTAFLDSVEKVKIQIQKELDEQKKGFPLLPPRQEEIYRIIKDHRMISSDFIKRRFLKFPKRTINYELRRLINKGLIIKIGKTKGSFYTLKK